MTVVYSVLFQAGGPPSWGILFATSQWSSKTSLAVSLGAFMSVHIDPAGSEKTVALAHPTFITLNAVCAFILSIHNFLFTFITLGHVHFFHFLRPWSHFCSVFYPPQHLEMDILCCPLFLVVLSPLNTLRAAMIKNSILTNKLKRVPRLSFT